jgi:hypothetical protein
MLYETRPLDLTVFMLVSLALLLVAGAACNDSSVASFTAGSDAGASGRID